MSELANGFILVVCVIIGVILLELLLNKAVRIYASWLDRRNPKRCHICGVDDGICEEDGFCYDCYEGVVKYLSGNKQCHICGTTERVNTSGFCETCYFEVQLMRIAQQSKSTT